MDAKLRESAAAGEAVAYAYQGDLTMARPDPYRALGYVRARLLRAFNAGGQGDSFYVALIYRVNCPAPAALPWRRF